MPAVGSEEERRDRRAREPEWPHLLEVAQQRARRGLAEWDDATVASRFDGYKRAYKKIDDNWYLLDEVCSEETATRTPVARARSTPQCPTEARSGSSPESKAPA